MVQLALAFVTAALVSVQASPFLNKRIAQDITQSTVKWEKACLAATNSQECNPLAVAAFNTLLAASTACDQQDQADNLMDFFKKNEKLIKSKEKGKEMIKLAQIFCQQPRNSPNSISIPYCQKAPRNSELNNLFQCQYIGDAPFKPGASGSIPFGMTAPPNPPGSCSAHPQGPIADGTQLSDITTEPFASGPAATDTGSDGTPSTPTAPPDDGNSPPSSSSAAADTTVPTAAPPSTGDFHLQNGLDAQKLNLEFSKLDASAPCDANKTPNACINDQLAQCDNGKFILTPCASGTKCFALPLVNKPGTSVTCDNEDDAISRISATGATGGLTG